jgi:ABC-type uncharacterized transport system substrate-binding protein
MKYIKTIYILCIVLLLVKTGYAHPHIFIHTDIDVYYNATGIEKLHVQFHFDEIFSEDLMQNFDADKNKSFSTKEIAEIKSKAFNNLKNYNYFIHIRAGGKKITIEDVSNFSARIDDGIVVYSFDVQKHIPVSRENTTIKISPYDHSYYIAVYLNKQNIRFHNTDSFIHNYSVIEDKSQAYYYEQIYPETIVLQTRRKS